MEEREKYGSSHRSWIESTGTKPFNPWLCRFIPVTRKTPPTLSKVTPGHIRISRVSNLLSKALPARRVGETTGEGQGAYPVAPQARSTWVSSTSEVAGSSVGRFWLAGWAVKWLRMSTNALQSAIKAVLDVSSTKVPSSHNAASKGVMEASSSAIVIANSDGETSNPNGANALSNTVLSCSAAVSSGIATVTSAVADMSPAGMVKSTLPINAV